MPNSDPLHPTLSWKLLFTPLSHHTWTIVILFSLVPAKLPQSVMPPACPRTCFGRLTSLLFLSLCSGMIHSFRIQGSRDHMKSRASSSTLTRWNFDNFDFDKNNNRWFFMYLVWIANEQLFLLKQSFSTVLFCVSECKIAHGDAFTTRRKRVQEESCSRENES